MDVNQHSCLGYSAVCPRSLSFVWGSLDSQTGELESRVNLGRSPTIYLLRFWELARARSQPAFSWSLVSSGLIQNSL